MLEPAKIPLARVRSSILRFGAICFVFYAVYLLFMRALGISHITALRAVNYLVLFAVCFYGIKKWIAQTGLFVPFLTVFATTFFTGVFSFLLFCIFLFFYAKVDDTFTQVMAASVPALFKASPAILVFCEGAAVSIIVGFINMQYFRRYEEGEAGTPKHPVSHKGPGQN